MISGWTQLLGGAACGFVTGFLLEPVKGWLNSFIKARQIKDAIYDDLALLHRQISLLQVEGSQALEIPSRRSQGEEQFYQRLEGVHTGRFDHYYATERTAFYKLRGADDIKRFYEAVRELIEPNADTPFDQKVELVWSAGEKYENLSNWGFLKSANIPKREKRHRAEGLKNLQHFETTIIERMREEVSGKSRNPKVRKHQKLVEKIKTARKGGSSDS